MQSKLIGLASELCTACYMSRVGRSPRFESGIIPDVRRRPGLISENVAHKQFDFLLRKAVKPLEMSCPRLQCVRPRLAHGTPFSVPSYCNL